MTDKISSEDFIKAFGGGVKHNLKRPQGDLISREALKETIIEPLNVNDAGKNEWYEGYYTAKNEDVTIIDNAPPVPQVTVFTENADEKAIEDMKAELQSVIEARPQGEQIAWEQGYEIGLAQGKAETRPQGEYTRVDTLWAKCSICGNLTRVIKKYNMPNFCPACGADMRRGAK